MMMYNLNLSSEVLERCYRMHRPDFLSDTDFSEGSDTDEASYEEYKPLRIPDELLSSRLVKIGAQSPVVSHQNLLKEKQMRSYAAVVTDLPVSKLKDVIGEDGFQMVPKRRANHKNHESLSETPQQSEFYSLLPVENATSLSAASSSSSDEENVGNIATSKKGKKKKRKDKKEPEVSSPEPEVIVKKTRRRRKKKGKPNEVVSPDVTEELKSSSCGLSKSLGGLADAYNFFPGKLHLLGDVLNNNFAAETRRKAKRQFGEGDATIDMEQIGLGINHCFTEAKSCQVAYDEYLSKTFNARYGKRKRGPSRGRYCLKGLARLEKELFGLARRNERYNERICMHHKMHSTGEDVCCPKHADELASHITSQFEALCEKMQTQSLTVSAELVNDNRKHTAYFAKKTKRLSRWERSTYKKPMLFNISDHVRTFHEFYLNEVYVMYVQQPSGKFRSVCHVPTTDYYQQQIEFPHVDLFLQYDIYFDSVSYITEQICSYAFFNNMYFYMSMFCEQTPCVFRDKLLWEERQLLYRKGRRVQPESYARFMPVWRLQGVLARTGTSKSKRKRARKKLAKVVGSSGVDPNNSLLSFNSGTTRCLSSWINHTLKALGCEPQEGKSGGRHLFAAVCRCVLGKSCALFFSICRLVLYSGCYIVRRYFWP